MKDSTIKKLEKVKELNEVIEKIKYTLKHGFIQPVSVYTTNTYGVTDKLKNKFVSIQSTYLNMVYESVEKFETYSISPKYLGKANSCYKSLLDIKKYADKGDIYIPDPNLYFIEEFADKEFIHTRLVRYINKSYEEYFRLAQDEIILLEEKLDQLLENKIEVVEVKSDYIKNIATLAGYIEKKEGVYSFKDEDKEVSVQKLQDSNRFMLSINGRKSSYIIKFPEVLAYSGLYRFLRNSISIKSLDSLISSVKYYGFTEFDEYLSEKLK